MNHLIEKFDFLSVTKKEEANVATIEPKRCTLSVPPKHQGALKNDREEMSMTNLGECSNFHNLPI